MFTLVVPYKLTYFLGISLLNLVLTHPRLADGVKDSVHVLSNAYSGPDSMLLPLRSGECLFICSFVPNFHIVDGYPNRQSKVLSPSESARVAQLIIPPSIGAVFQCYGMTD